ncbi:ATP-dependent helicase [Methanobacterium sp. SMA-27]|uniref:ATP-dependent helicase n=1 Tax=Methanobacterium sp. SMA-27 TaxID=1495336 RepID=UPI00064FB610|nr:ATP-dependent helicase [Methanobacterium sp. SMA-27]
MIKLTETQKEICKAKDKYIIVRACPGSGKTFTVAAKMAQLLKDWPYSYQGVAVISFTNAAWEEIEKELKKSFYTNIPIKYPHFLGTIDSFINQFIFFPYGHLVINCKSRPVLAGEPAYPWKTKKNDGFHNQFFDKISYDINGNLSKIKKIHVSLAIQSQYNYVKNMKNRLWRSGLFNQSDANYFAMKIIDNYPSIAKLIALRFPFIIIDEAQDTSEIQMKIIDAITNSQLENIMLVGDPDQAIFEWNSANPDLFNEKCNQDGWNCITMNESLRSSQKICNFTHFLTKLKEPSTSINNDKNIVNFKFNPEIWEYNPNNNDFDDELINPFLKICEENEITLTSSNIAILARSNNLIDEIILSRQDNIEISNLPSNTLDSVWIQENFTKELAKSKYLYDKSEFQKSFQLLEKTYISLLSNTPVYSDYKLSEIIRKIGYFDFKNEIFNLIKLMPKTDVSIGKWIERFNENLHKDGRFLNYIDLEIKKGYHDMAFDDLFSYNIIDNEIPYNLSTIHKVKGETFEAVLLILKKGSAGPMYRTLLTNNKKTEDHEELKNVYVGITRPRKILVLAVPSEDIDIWKQYFSKTAQTSLDNLFK